MHFTRRICADAGLVSADTTAQLLWLGTASHTLAMLVSYSCVTIFTVL